MSNDLTPLAHLLSLLVKEGKRRFLLLTTILSVVALSALAIGLALPKRYDASTLLVVEASSMKPLLEGRQVNTGTVESTSITLQITEGRKILRELLVFGGWVNAPPAPQPDPRDEAKMLERLRKNIQINSPKDGIIRIGFSDSDPVRTYKVANKLAEIYIRESGEAQQRESREAFDFIDKQVKDYGEQLATYHQQVLAHYQGKGLPMPGSSGAPDASAPPPRPTVTYVPGTKKSDISADELAALRTEKITLETQLARRPTNGGVDSRGVDQARARVGQLQADLDRALATYTDQHPDVKRLRRELATAQEDLRTAEEAQTAGKAEAARTAALDEDLRRAATLRLDEVNRQIAAATGRPSVSNIAVAPSPRNPPPAPAPGEPRIDPELRGIGQDTTLSELVRHYEATRDVYQDLLKRRESARVSMELMAQHRGQTVRVQEPAELPLAASGLRLSQFCVVGLILSLVLPLVVLFVIVRFDRRLRSPTQIEIIAKVPLLVSIGAGFQEKEQSRARRHKMLALAMLVGVGVVYVAVFLIKTRNTT